MQIVGNNIANVNTFGFKRNHVAFADLMGNSWPQGAAFTKASNGVKIGAVEQDYSQGAFEATNLNTDLAIAGGGFGTCHGARRLSRSSCLVDQQALLLRL